MIKDLILLLAIPVIVGVVADLTTDLIRQKIKDKSDNQ